MTYTVKDMKISDRVDAHGNTWVNVAFEEYGEPVAMVVKDPHSVKQGNKYDGEIKELTSQKGSKYNRFFRDKPQDFSQGSQQRGGTKREYTRDDSAIQAQWAIGQANTQAVNGLIEADAVEEKAKDFFDMIDRVKNHDKPEEDKHLNDDQKQVAAVVPNADKMVELSEIPF